MARAIVEPDRVTKGKEEVGFEFLTERVGGDGVGVGVSVGVGVGVGVGRGRGGVLEEGIEPAVQSLGEHG